MFVKIIAIQYLSQLAAQPVRPDFKIIILGEALGQKDENTVNINSSKNSNFKVQFDQLHWMLFNKIFLDLR